MLREGREEGLRTGINYGELQNLVRMVLKKMRKDVSCEITAELFEEPVEKIRKIYEVAENMRRNMILSQFAENWRHKVLWLHRKGMSLYLTGGFGIV